MKKNRDDFSEATKKLLRERVGNCCSNPDCKVITNGAHSVSSKLINIGVAAHITAAAPGKGAARYNPKLTPDQRSNYDNGIWLCQTCSKLIDSDENQYTVPILQQWKNSAESRSEQLIGKKLFSESETKKLLVKEISEFIKSEVIHPEKTINNVVSALAGIDERLKITTTSDGEKIVHSISAKSQNVPLGMKFENLTLEQYQAITDVIEKGNEITINSENMKVTGSPFFSMFDNLSDSQLTITPNKTPVEFDLYFYNENKEYFISKLKCQLQSGSKYYSVNPVNENDLFKIKLDNHSGTDKANFTINFSCWKNKDVREIFILDKLYRIISNLNFNFDIKIEISNNEDPEIVVINSSENKELQGLIYSKFIPIIKYISSSKTISEKLSIAIFYDPYNFSSEEFKNVVQIAELLSKEVIVTHHAHRKIRMELTTEDRTIENTIETSHDKLFRFEHPSVENIFNTSVTLPKINNYFFGSDCHVLSCREGDGHYIYDIEFSFNEAGTIETKLS